MDREGKNAAIKSAVGVFLTFLASFLARVAGDWLDGTKFFPLALALVFAIGILAIFLLPSFYLYLLSKNKKNLF